MGGGGGGDSVVKKIIDSDPPIHYEVSSKVTPFLYLKATHIYEVKCKRVNSDINKIIDSDHIYILQNFI